MDSDMREALKEQAYDDCIKYGTPTLGVDHGTHYKLLPYQTSATPDDKQEKEND